MSKMKKMLCICLSVYLTFMSVKFDADAQKETVTGDINGDGVVTAVDGAILVDYLLNCEKTIDMISSDINNDTTVNIVDLILFKQLLAEGASLPQVTEVTTVTEPKVTTVTEVSQTETTTENQETSEPDISSDEKKAAMQINSQRSMYGFGELEVDETLCFCSDARAKELAEKYSSGRPDGSSYTTIFKEYNIDAEYTFQFIGKDIKNVDKLVDEFNIALNNSIMKGLNIMLFKEIGVGHYGDYWVVFMK